MLAKLSLMVLSNAIKWEQSLDEMSLLEKHIQTDFESYFKANYINSHSLTRELTTLNDFLKGLNKQELDIFLNLKGNFAKDYLNDRTFPEILLYCIERTGPPSKRPLLFALEYILLNHLSSREKVLENVSIIEKIANSDNGNINFKAKDILNVLEKPFEIPLKPQYFFDDNSEFHFHVQFIEIIKRAKDKIWFWDNYANEDILTYIHNFVDKDSLKEINIICNDQKPNPKTAKKRILPLQLAASKFIKEYSKIKLEIRSSSSSHDRFIVIDEEVWTLGPSLKDGGKTACTIVQLKEKAAHDLELFFQKELISSSSI